jgi:hypothetical protein
MLLDEVRVAHRDSRELYAREAMAKIGDDGMLNRGIAEVLRSTPPVDMYLRSLGGLITLLMFAVARQNCAR